MIEFLHISIRNFRSWNYLDLDLHDQGVVCVKGGTGHGKSSIWTALYWGLYGSTPEDTRADEIRGSRKPTAVRIVLRRENEKFYITRYRAHPEYKNKVFFLGPGIPDVVEDSYVKTVQQLINTFLGVTPTLFLTTTYFAQRNFHHFHTLTDTQKKAFLESITYGSLFEACESITRNKVHEGERDIARLSGQLQGLEESLQSIKAQSKERKEEIHQEIRDLRIKVASIKTHILKLGNSKKNLEHFVDDKKQIDSDIFMVQDSISEKKEDIIRYESQDERCPRCGLIMLENLKNERIQECKEAIINLEKEYEHLTHRRIGITLGYKKFLNAEKWLDEKEIEQEHCESQIGFLQQSLIQVDNSKELQEKIFKIKDTIVNVKQALSYASFWVKGFGFNGLRSYVLMNAISYLSDRISHYLRKVMHERIEFLITLENNRLLTECNGRSYGSLSGGERQAVDLCTGLAMRDLAERYNKSQFNLLVLDEPSEGLDKNLTAISQALLLEYAKPSTFLVTHQDFSGNFDQLFEVKKFRDSSRLHKIY